LWLPPWQLALSFGSVDRSIPLTLFYALSAHALGLGDWLLRLPSLVAGLATLVVCPWLVRRHLGRRGSHLFAWLLAVAPLLVFYSRTLRPYGIGALFGFLSLHFAETWWRSGARRAALGYGATAALGTWFLPPLAPFALAPLAVLLAARIRRPARALALVAPPALAFAAFAAPLLAPPLLAHPEALFDKLGASRPDAGALVRAAGFWLGTRSPWLALALLVPAALGAWRLARREPRFTALALASGAALALGVLASAPRYAWLGFVLGRYAVPALPLLLVFAAAGLDATGARPGRPAVASAALCALWLWSGGIPALLLDTRAWFPGRWVTWMEGQAPEPRRVPDFYRRLAERPPGSLTLVESPWYYSLWNNLLPHYEAIHRQRTLIGMTTGLCSDAHWGEYPPGRGVSLHSFAHLADARALAARGADFVIFHRDPAGELSRPVDPVDLRATGQPDVGGCIEAYRRLGWPEVHADPQIVVFQVPGGEGGAALSPPGRSRPPGSSARRGAPDRPAPPAPPRA